MHIDVVRFDEVFDVQAARGDFSFRTGGKPVYGVNLRRGLIPAPGSRYAVAFERPGDWSTVQAWRALDTSEVQFREPGWAAALMFLADFFWFAPAIIGGGLVVAGPWTALALLGAFLVLVALGAAWVVLQNRKIERALLAHGSTLGTRDKTGPLQERPAP